MYEIDPYIPDIEPGDTRGLIKEYRYRHKFGFHKKYGGRWNGVKAIIKSIFIKQHR